jgi:DNA-directed RNA polymerase specialized sigma24 family protein
MSNLARENLDRLACSLLSGSEDENLNSLLPAINRWLRQFQLQNNRDAYEVFSETYKRAAEVLDAGRTIDNIPAWFRTTAFNVVREWSRSSRREACEPHDVIEKTRNASVDFIAAPLAVLDMLKIFNELDPVDQKILKLNASGLSWQEVADQLNHDEANRFTADSVAQRACRSRKKLREFYSPD